MRPTAKAFASNMFAGSSLRFSKTFFEIHRTCPRQRLLSSNSVEVPVTWPVRWPRWDCPSGLLTRIQGSHRNFRVERAYGHELPVDNSTADFVLGSHVLEHIPEPYLRLTIRETLRVLKPSGKAIFLLPSSSTMLLTILLQPAGNMRRLLIHLKRLVWLSGPSEKSPCNNPLLQQRESLKLKVIKGLTIRWFLPAPHGVGKSALHEIWNWRFSKWSAVFAQNGFEVIDVRKSGFAASNHQLFGDRSWYFRRLLAMLGMHASNVFILRKH